MIRFYIGTVILVLFAGCARYSFEEDAHSINGLEIENLHLPENPFSYYMMDAYRGAVIVLNCDDNSFFELNRDSVSWTAEDVEIDPSGGRDFTAHFKDAPFDLPFDFDIQYTYYRIDASNTNVNVDGLFNETAEIYLVRIVVPGPVEDSKSNIR